MAQGLAERCSRNGIRQCLKCLAYRICGHFEILLCSEILSARAITQASSEDVSDVFARPGITAELTTILNFDSKPTQT